MNKFHNMDLNYYNNLLKESKKISNNNNLDILEKKYQKLISGYSQAYLDGSDWYIGPSFIDYIKKQCIYKFVPIKLSYVSNILNKIEL